MSDRPRPRPTRAVVTLAVVGAVVATVLVLDENVSPDRAKDPESPPSVSAEEFCTTFQTLNAANATNVTAPSPEATQDLKDAAAALAEIVDGTEMSDEAKAGVRFITSLLLALDEVATVEEISTFDQQATLQDTANARALGEYVADNCVAPLETDPK